MRNETFDRYQFFNCKQEHNESLEKFHSRIKQKAALCNWEHLEDSLVKRIFIQCMRNPQIQMDLLSEDRDPIGTLQYALAREKGQENQQKMTNAGRSHFDTNPQGQSDVQYIRRNNTQQRQSTQQRTGILQTPKSGQIPDCWKCGYKFIPGHLSNCPAKNEVCRICKKIGHYAKMCKQKCHLDQHKDRQHELTYKVEALHPQIKITITNKTQETLKQHPRMTYHRQRATTLKKTNPSTPRAHAT